MLRLCWRSTAVPPRLLSEDVFIRDFDSLTGSGSAGVAPGPVLVEGLDEHARVAWTGYYRSAADLRQLLRQLVEERDKGFRDAAPTADSGGQRSLRGAPT